MQLLFVRHALPERVEGIDTGADPGLTERGHAQAGRLPSALSGYGVSAIVSSPMRRARETAAPLAGQLGLEINVDEDLAEYDLGQSGYIPIHEARAAHPDLYARVLAGHLPDFVDADAFSGRVRGAIDRIIAAHAHDQTIAVVSHGGVINIYLQQLLGLEKPLTFPIEYVSVTRLLVSRDGSRKVASVNETGHVRDIVRV